MKKASTIELLAPDIAFAMTSPARIEINTTMGVRIVEGYYYFDWAMHPVFHPTADHWVITHLATGMAADRAGVFDSPPAAAVALVALHELRSDWWSMSIDEIQSMGAEIKTLHRLAGAFMLDDCPLVQEKDLIRADLNRRVRQ